jgi:hypothetical protein
MKQTSVDPTIGGIPKASGTVAASSADSLQRLMDEVAGFSLYACPDLSSKAEGGSGRFVGSATLARFNIALQPPSKHGVRASNTLGESVGRLDIRWSMIPNEYLARPDREPPSCPLAPAVSQRFVMQEATFTFGEGRDGFRSFGTGRTFPMMVGNQPRVVAAAVGNVVEGFGRFRGHEGNFTICGDLQPNGFRGHIIVRMIDPAGELRTQADLPAIQVQAAADPHTTYLQWGGQKGPGKDQENRFSLGPDGQVKGMNIPLLVKLLRLDCAFARDFQIKNFEMGEVIGREIGFGKASVPGADPVGSPLSPFLFDGVAHYNFLDGAGTSVGTITTNVLEGRRFDMKLAGAPDAPALRFGFFGPIIAGSGCFHGVEGMIYGSTGSVLSPPPGIHVITHFCAARITDPHEQFRARFVDNDGSR